MDSQAPVVGQSASQQNFSAVDGLPLRKVGRMTPSGDWVWAWQSDWKFDSDANEGRSVAENDAIQQEHAEPHADGRSVHSAEAFQRVIDTGLRYKAERDTARQKALTLERLVRRAAPFVNAVTVLAEHKSPSLAWLADAAAALPGRKRLQAELWHLERGGSDV